MNKTTKRLLFAVLILLLFLLTVYFVLALYYREGFSLNTWINGVYCTGKTVEEVNSELLSHTEAPDVVIVNKAGEKYTITLADVDYHADFSSALEAYRQEQNPYLWVDNVLFHSRRTLAPAVTVDEEALRRAYNALDFVQTEQKRIKDYSLTRDAEGAYVFTDGLSDRIDLEKAFLALKQIVENGQETLNLQESGCYYEITPDESQKALRNLWKEIERFQTCDIVYCFGEERHPMIAADCAFFLTAENGLPVQDEKGSFVLDEEAVTAYVQSLAEEYDGYGRTRQFHSTRGDVITIDGGTYGSKMDRKKETAYLLEHLLDPGVHTGTPQSHIPSYEREAFCYGKNDIGDTYIEVDMTEQKMYYYEKGVLKLDTEIVTGNMRRRMGTPEGVNFVYNKQKNRVLRGPGYASPVKFWMPVKGGIGIHDAGWRKEFGGDIYQTAGSHGCINLPPSVAKTIFDNISAGTPVICYNLPGTEKSTTSGTAKPAETKPAETTAPAETPAPAETQAPAPAETQAPGPAPTTAPTQAETKAPETAAPTQAGPGGPSGDNGGNIAVGPGA